MTLPFAATPPVIASTGVNVVVPGDADTVPIAGLGDHAMSIGGPAHA